MGRFFIDNAPRKHGALLMFRVLVEESNSEHWVDSEAFAKLVGVDKIAEADLTEGALFESGNPKPTDHLTEERRRLLDDLMKQVAIQLPGLNDNTPT